VNLAIPFIKMRSSLILNCFFGLFPFYYAICWSGRGKEENCGGRIGGGMEEIGLSSLSGE